MSAQKNALSPRQTILQNTFPQLMTLCLGFFSLANAFALVDVVWVRYIAAVATGFVMLVMLLRIIANPSLLRAELSELAGLAAYQTGFMATYFLAGVLYNFGFTVGIWLWCVTLCINVVQVAIFVRHLWIHRLGFRAMTPMWYLLGMGIGAAAIPGVVMGFRTISTILMLHTVIGVIVCTPAILHNFFNGKPEGQIMRPIKAILCAAPSLAATLLHVVWPDVNFWIPFPFLLMGQCFLIWIYVHLPYFIGCPFMITLGSLTFPLGISASAFILTIQAYVSPGSAAAAVVNILYRIELTMGTLIILYVILRFALAQQRHYKQVLKNIYE